MKYEQDNYEQTRKRMPRVGRRSYAGRRGCDQCDQRAGRTVRVRIAVGVRLNCASIRSTTVSDPKGKRKPRVEEEDPAVEDEQSAPQGGVLSLPATRAAENLARHAERREAIDRKPQRRRPGRARTPTETGRGSRPPRKPMDRPEQPVKPEAPKQAEQPVRQRNSPLWAKGG
ncbi:MAG: hypothetical protein ACLTBF_01185 [Christensenellales bacterium]